MAVGSASFSTMDNMSGLFFSALAAGLGRAMEIWGAPFMSNPWPFLAIGALLLLSAALPTRRRRGYRLGAERSPQQTRRRRVRGPHGKHSRVALAVRDGATDGIGSMLKPLFAATAVALVLFSLSGCAAEDPRNLVSPESAAEQRPAAEQTAEEATTLDGPGLALVDSRTVDNCGVDATGTQPTDYSNTYRCGLGRVALYAVSGNSAAEAATAVDSAMATKGCSSASPLSSSPDALATVESTGSGTHAIETFYQCGDTGAEAIFGLATDVGIAINLPDLPPSPAGTAITDDPPITAETLASAATGGNKFVLVLHLSTEYFTTSVCDGLHRC